MGTFFDLVDINEIVLQPIPSISPEEIARFPPGTFLYSWREFTTYAGIGTILGFEERKFCYEIVKVKNYLDKNLEAEIFDAIFVVADVIVRDYVFILNFIRGNMEGEHPKSIIQIDIQSLHRHARKSSSDNQISGTFISELKEEAPEIISRLNIEDRKTFEKGVASYQELLSASAEARHVDAQKKLHKAKEIESEADYITAFAHQKTDAALGAEATAEGLERLTTHWRDKADFHQSRRESNFLLFAMVLAASLILLFLSQTGVLKATFFNVCGDSAFCPTPVQRYLAELALHAKTNGSWATALLSLKGVLIPILGVAWLLRILSRQNQFHFALENDARQRLALLVSLVRLQELPEVKLTDEERLMILTALFRPAEHPAHPEGPPNVSELLAKIKP